jgi:hypothetical protein
MLLRRITEHVKAQNWTAVALDFVIVVMGVFIGIQVSNWNATRSDARAYGDALDRLRGEIAANLKMLDAADNDLGAEAPIVRRAFDALETCSDDPDTRRAVNDGLKLISGSNGLEIRSSELEQLTSDPRLLAQQSAATRDRLSSLKHVSDMVERSARYFQDIPIESRAERIRGIRPGSRIEYEAMYLGFVYEVSRRPRELDEPVSAACTSQDIAAALWLWDRMQSNLPIFVQIMRAEYEVTLKALDVEAQ